MSLASENETMNMQGNSKPPICMLIPYFGAWPKWFDLYLYSCSRVREIDFYYFTDCEVPDEVYPNTKFYRTTLEFYAEKVSKALGISFPSDSPYKLCDLKPFLGKVHPDIVSEYTFWGWSDIDLIYGNLEPLLCKENLMRYDLITSHSNLVAGHFTIIRRGSRFDGLSTKIRDWKAKLQDECNHALDEQEFSFLSEPSLYLMRVVWKAFLSRFRQSKSREEFRSYQVMQDLLEFTHPRALFHECYSTLVPEPGQRWVYELGPGSIKEAGLGEELPYLHFLYFKKTRYLDTDRYWRSGFWRIPDNHRFTSRDKVQVSLRGIDLLEVDGSVNPIEEVCWHE
jgi:hypothetical protein